MSRTTVPVGMLTNTPPVLLSSQDASSSSTLNFTGLTGYTSYSVELCNVAPATNSVALVVRVSDDNGATYKAGGTDYSYAYLRSASGGSSNQGSASASYIALIDAIRNSANQGVTGYMTLGRLSGTRLKQFSWIIGGYLADNAMWTANGSGAYAATDSTTINAIQFLTTSGNIASGTIRVYGVL